MLSSTGRCVFGSSRCNLSIASLTFPSVSPITHIEEKRNTLKWFSPEWASWSHCGKQANTRHHQQSDHDKHDSVAEWSKAVDSSSTIFGCEGSNPTVVISDVNLVRPFCFV